VRLNLTKIDNLNTMEGLNGYASIDGSAFKMPSTYYGFANDHASLISFRNSSNFEVMLVRNLNYYDDKGITDPMTDRNMNTYEQLHYLAPTASEYLKRRSQVGDNINQKNQVRILGPTNDPEKDHKSFGLMKYSSRVSPLNGEIDMVFADIDPEREVVIFNLRNTKPYPVKIHPFWTENTDKTDLPKLFNRSEKTPYKASRELTGLKNLRNSYSDMAMEFAEYIVPILEWSGDQYSIPPFSFEVFEVPFTNLEYMFEDPEQVDHSKDGTFIPMEPKMEKLGAPSEPELLDPPVAPQEEYPTIHLPPVISAPAPEA